MSKVVIPNSPISQTSLPTHIDKGSQTPCNYTYLKFHLILLYYPTKDEALDNQFIIQHPRTLFDR